ncbi:MAG: esterase [Aquabacterium sp.]|nr:esterase [Aquabacterium sp.]
MPATAPLMPDTLQWLPATGLPGQLMVLLHGWGASADDMAPLAQALQAAFPQAALLAPQGFEPVETGLAGRQWFGLDGDTEANHPALVAAVLPRLATWLRAAQQASGVGPAATALVGFSQGAIAALELAQLHDGIAGRVLSFAGRYATLPTVALAHTTLHFFHGATDTVIPAAQSRLAMERLRALQGDATIDIASGVGHDLPPALVQCAVQRLQTHIPHRTWMAAMGAVPGLAGRQGAEDD